MYVSYVRVARKDEEGNVISPEKKMTPVSVRAWESSIKDQKKNGLKLHKKLGYVVPGKVENGVQTWKDAPESDVKKLKGGEKKSAKVADNRG